MNYFHSCVGAGVRAVSGVSTVPAESTASPVPGARSFAQVPRSIASQAVRLFQNV